jgi:hypothetical protein
MWAYPLPSLIAFAGWLYVLGTAGAWHIAGGGVVIVSGTLAFALWRVCGRGGT